MHNLSASLCAQPTAFPRGNIRTALFNCYSPPPRGKSSTHRDTDVAAKWRRRRGHPGRLGCLAGFDEGPQKAGRSRLLPIGAPAHLPRGAERLIATGNAYYATAPPAAGSMRASRHAASSRHVRPLLRELEEGEGAAGDKRPRRSPLQDAVEGQTMSRTSSAAGHVREQHH